ncbi:hypothetical protein scyTo_0023044, partial [Scyliorhinus torazame]|nr:hypothetical protein [Scyliorhinus torazame]
DSVSEVEDLIKKHEDFEKMLEAQDEKIGQLKNVIKGEGFRTELNAKEKERKVARVPSLKRKAFYKKPAPLRMLGRTNSDIDRPPKSWSKEVSPPQSNSTGTPKSEKVTPQYQTMEGTLDRKHRLHSGGTKAVSKAWATYFVILEGQALCFYKNKSETLT